MSVLALINDEKAIDLLLPWALTFAKAREGALIVVCWTEAAVPGIGDSEDANEANAQLVQAVNMFFSHSKSTDRPEVIAVFGPIESKAAIDVAKQNKADLIVALAEDPTGAKGGQLRHKFAAETVTRHHGDSFRGRNAVEKARPGTHCGNRQHA